ncbi:unnamed protein product [Camellia sinensis]
MLSYWLSNSSTLLLLLQRTLKASGAAGMALQRRRSSSATLFGRMTQVLNAGKNKLKSMDEGRSLLSLRALILNGSNMEREVKFFTETKENNQMRGPRTGIATAGLGVIHRGHLQQGRSLMAPYLPQSGAGGGGSPYSEGGALYALDLIHANHGEGIKTISSLFSMVHAWVWAWQLLELLMKISMTTSEAVNFVRNQLRQHGDVQCKPVYMYSMGGLADFCVVPVHGEKKERQTQIQKEGGDLSEKVDNAASDLKNTNVRLEATVNQIQDRED